MPCLVLASLGLLGAVWVWVHGAAGIRRSQRDLPPRKDQEGGAR